MKSNGRKSQRSQIDSDIAWKPITVESHATWKAKDCWGAEQWSYGNWQKDSWQYDWWQSYIWNLRSQAWKLGDYDIWKHASWHSCEMNGVHCWPDAMEVCQNSIRRHNSKNIIRVTGVTLNFACALATLRCVFEDIDFIAKRDLHTTKTDDRNAIVSQEYRFMVYEGYRKTR